MRTELFVFKNILSRNKRREMKTCQDVYFLKEVKEKVTFINTSTKTDVFT